MLLGNVMYLEVTVRRLAFSSKGVNYPLESLPLRRTESILINCDAGLHKTLIKLMGAPLFCTCEYNTLKCMEVMPSYSNFVLRKLIPEGCWSWNTEN